MAARETFQFGQYTLRPAGIEKNDYALAFDWTLADADHRGRVQPHFWTDQGEGEDAYLLLDREGPLLFFKVFSQGARVEMHMEFPPDSEDEVEQRHIEGRIAKGLLHGLTWLERVLSQSQVKQMVFESASPRLIKFSTERLGFTQENGRLSKLF
jgi:hypothetical protein